MTMFYFTSISTIGNLGISNTSDFSPLFRFGMEGKRTREKEEQKTNASKRLSKKKKEKDEDTLMNGMILLSSATNLFY
jgi:hypothetical protein